MCDLRSDLRQYFNLNLTNPCVEILSYIFWLDFAVSCVILSVSFTLEPNACSAAGGIYISSNKTSITHTQEGKGFFCVTRILHQY